MATLHDKQTATPRQSSATPGIILRDLSERENYSGRAIKKAEIVYLFSGCTYGCIAAGGVAATYSSAGYNPFFEIPEDSVRWQSQ